MSTQKSTIDRSLVDAKASVVATEGGLPPSFRAVRAGLGGLASISPALAARLLERTWFTPPRRGITEPERAQLSRGTALTLSVDGRRVAAWSFGTGPAVLLIHGWGGRGAQLLGFVRPLVEAGLRALVFDGLSHGASAPSALGRRQGSFVDVARCALAVAEHAGGVHAIVAHSGGAIASGIALERGLRAERISFVAPMVRPARYADLFDAAFELPEEVGARWRASVVRRVGVDWDDLDLTTAAARFELPKALVVHDRADKKVPFDESEALRAAWPDAELVATEGLGHQRILQDPEIVRRVVDFIRLP